MQSIWKANRIKNALTKAFFSDRKDVSKRDVYKQAYDVGLNAEDDT